MTEIKKIVDGQEATLVEEKEGLSDVGTSEKVEEVLEEKPEEVTYIEKPGQIGVVEEVWEGGPKIAKEQKLLKVTRTVTLEGIVPEELGSTPREYNTYKEILADGWELEEVIRLSEIYGPFKNRIKDALEKKATAVGRKNYRGDDYDMGEYYHDELKEFVKAGDVKAEIYNKLDEAYLSVLDEIIIPEDLGSTPAEYAAYKKLLTDGWEVEEVIRLSEIYGPFKDRIKDSLEKKAKAARRKNYKGNEYDMGEYYDDDLKKFVKAGDALEKKAK